MTRAAIPSAPATAARVIRPAAAGLSSPVFPITVEE